MSTATPPPGSVVPPSPAELEARSAFLEVTAGFFAALGAGVAGSFINDKTAPHWLVLALLVASFALGIGAMVWLGAVYGRVRAHRTSTALKQRRVTSESRVWVPLIAFGAALVVVMTAVTIWLGGKTDPDFSSVYDGQDAKAASCIDGSEKPVPDQGTTPFLDLDGKQVGQVQLMASRICGTVWAQVSIDEPERERLKGTVARIVMYRPGDGDTEPYPLRLRGGPSGTSNMISAVEVCVQAKVRMTKESVKGPETSTPCKMEDL